jgi:hypothetical protein
MAIDVSDAGRRAAAQAASTATSIVDSPSHPSEETGDDGRHGGDGEQRPRGCQQGALTAHHGHAFEQGGHGEQRNREMHDARVQAAQESTPGRV